MKEPTDKELNETICKWLGWQFINDSGGHHVLPPGMTIQTYIHVGKPVIEPLEFVEGTEALFNMRSAEDGLSETEAEVYADRIIKQYPGDRTNAFAWIHSSAKDRAVALCQVVAPEIFQETEALPAGNADWCECRCVDCYGDKPAHDSTCSYMLELTRGDAEPEQAATT